MNVLTKTADSNITASMCFYGIEGRYSYLGRDAAGRSFGKHVSDGGRTFGTRDHAIGAFRFEAAMAGFSGWARIIDDGVSLGDVEIEAYVRA